jgi:hypothetical protein
MIEPTSVKQPDSTVKTEREIAAQEVTDSPKADLVPPYISASGSISVKSGATLELASAVLPASPNSIDGGIDGRSRGQSELGELGALIPVEQQRKPFKKLIQEFVLFHQERGSTPPSFNIIAGLHETNVDRSNNTSLPKAPDVVLPDASESSYLNTKSDDILSEDWYLEFSKQQQSIFGQDGAVRPSIKIFAGDHKTNVDRSNE